MLHLVAQRRFHHWTSTLLLGAFLGLVGCRTTTTAWHPPCLTLNNGGAYQQPPLPFVRTAPTVNSDLQNPSVVRGRSKVTAAPLPTGEPSGSKIDSSVAGTGYRPDELGASEEQQVIRRQARELDQLPKENVPPRSSGPQLNSPAAKPDVKLSVEAIDSLPVNGEVAFKIRLTNSGDAPAEDLVLQCDFDEKLAFPGREELGIIQRLGRIDPGESREVDLSLLGKTEGESKILFSARSSNVDAITPVTRNLSIIPQSLFLELTGAGNARVGDRLTYKLSVRNSSTRPLSNISLILSSDRSLKPRLAQGNPEQRDDGWTWNIKQLAPGETQSFEVVLECLASADSALVKIIGTADGIPSDNIQANIEILPTPSPPMTRLNPPEIDLGAPESF